MTEDTPNYGNARIAKCNAMPVEKSVTITDNGMVLVVVGRQADISTTLHSNRLACELDYFDVPFELRNELITKGLYGYERLAGKFLE